MDNISIKIDGLDNIIKKFGQANGIIRERISKGLRDAELFLLRTAKQEVPVKTGNLQKSIEVLSRTQPFTGGISARAEYAAAVEFGTRPHKITSSRGLSDGKVFFGRSVNHPGTRANPFMQRTADKEADQVKAVFLEVADQIANDLVK